MILTVTLNASVDKLYRIETLRPGAVMRVKSVHNTAGGKGLNVSRVAALLGEPVRALGFVGGHTGALFESLLKDAGIEPCFTRIAAETRCCINICEEERRGSTELLEPGNPVRPDEIEAFLQDFDRHLPAAGAVVLSGSLPRGVPANFYAELVRRAHAAQKTVLVDASGEAAVQALRAGPDFIKPNADEIRQLLGQEISGTQQAMSAARQLQRGGVACAAVSLGRDGVVVSGGEGDLIGHTPDVAVVNTVGCGDSMVAAFAVGMVRGLPAEEQVRLAVAVSTANALTEETGSFRQEDLAELLPRIRVERAPG